MTALEKGALATFKDAPKVWLRFVDDIFAIVRRSAVESLLDHLNQQHPAIRFTIEIEEEGKLPFLDTAVHRCDGGKLRTSVYRKPTHTGAYLNFRSSHPLHAKRSVVSTLFQRLDHITAGEGAKKAEEKQIRLELETNGYPKSFINQTKARMLKRRNQVAGRAPKHTTNSTTTGTAVIPYSERTSEAISRVLAPLGIRTVARPTRRKWRLLKDAKDRLPTDTQAGVVYAVGCKNCPKVYIGETGRTVKQRLKEHQDHTKKGNVDKSAIANHIITTGHEIHWQARVIKREEHMLRRKVHEAVAIHKLAQKDDATMNLDRGMELSNLWFE